METPIEETIGYKIAISFKPFIDPKCTEYIEIVKDMARAINKHVDIAWQGKYTDTSLRVRQLLTSLEYDKLTDYQAKCVLLVEQHLK